MSSPAKQLEENIAFLYERLLHFRRGKDVIGNNK
jgi:hypothetical protein